MIQRPRLWVVEAISVLQWKDLVPALVKILEDVTRQQLLCRGEASVETISHHSAMMGRNATCSVLIKFNSRRD